MSFLNEYNIELFEKFLDGKLEGKELTDFENLLSSDPEARNELELFRIARETMIESGRMELKREIQKLQNKYNLSGRKWSHLKKNSLLTAGIVLTGLILFVYFSYFETGKFNSLNKYNTDNTQVTSPATHSTSAKKQERNDQQPKMDKMNRKNEVKESQKNMANTWNDGNKSIDAEKSKAETQGSNFPDNTADKMSSAEVPVVKFWSPDVKGCMPYEVRFFDSSFVKGGTITRYFWDFGDGTTSSAKNPVHLYVRNGIFTVKLIVWSNEDVKNEMVRNNYIVVNQRPEADFKAVPEIAALNDAKIVFNNLTKYASSKTKYLWDFGDNLSKSTLANPIHNYYDTGKYTVTLTATNEYACSSLKSKQVFIIGNTDVFIPSAFSPDGQGPSENNIYRVVATGIEKFHIQIFTRTGELLYESTDYANHGWNGNKLGSNVMMPAGVYVVKVTVTGINGQKYNFSNTVTLIK